MRSCYDDDNDAEDTGITWPEVLIPRDVQMYLGVGVNTFYRLIRSGELPAFRVGTLWRVRRKDLEQFCENH